MLLRLCLVLLIEGTQPKHYLFLNLLHLAANGVTLGSGIRHFEQIIEAADNFGAQVVKDTHDILTAKRQLLVLHFIFAHSILISQLATLYDIVVGPHVVPNRFLDILKLFFVKLLQL